MRRVSVVGALIATLTATAQLSGQVQIRDRYQLGLAGSGFLVSGGSNLNATASLTKFLGSALEFGGDLSLGVTSSQSGGTEVSGFAFGRIRYNFVGQSLTVPFLSFGAGTQLDSPSTGSRLALFQAGVGVKRFLNERASFNVEALGYGALQGGQFEIAHGVFVQFGLSYYFGR